MRNEPLLLAIILAAGLIFLIASVLRYIRLRDDIRTGINATQCESRDIITDEE